MPKLNLPIWIINLERSKDRLRHMSNLMEKFQLEHEVIKGIDGLELKKQELKKYYAPFRAFFNCSRFLFESEIGCALSHRKCWERVVKEDLPEVLILEDDVVFDVNFIEFLKRRQHLPDDWEFINFVTQTKGVPFGNPIYKNYRMAGFDKLHNRTVAYLINKKGAKKLLKHAYPITRPSDGITGRDYLTKINAYGISPKIGTVLNVESVIWDGVLKRKISRSIWKDIIINLVLKIGSIRLSNRMEEKLYGIECLPVYTINVIKDKIGAYKMKNRIQKNMK